MIRVEILGDGRQTCETGCGADWSKARIQQEARRALEQRFGNRVTLEYVDVAGDQRGHDSLGPDRSLPLLVVNGQVRLKGQFEIRQLVDAVEVEMELRASEQ